MKATGIVRRIDDLGRVVIPKEIRRTQLIRVGDPLEIFVSGAGEVIFKKYSPIGELSAFAASYAEVLYKAAGASVVERSLAPVYTRAVEQRRLFTAADAASALPLCEGVDTSATALMPILCNGDLIGSVALTGSMPDEAMVLLVKVAAAFLGKQMEE